MALEVERKFICTLTEEEAKRLSFSHRTVKSIYLESTPQRSLRVVKDISRDGIASCKWTEKQSTESLLARIEKEEFLPGNIFDILDNLKYPTVNKRRYVIRHLDHIWEVDFFEDYDFVIAELEFKSVKKAKSFTDFPPWIGKEVTEDPFYLNCNLANKK